ncbi:MAG: Maf family protein [Ginsengibacter sp.]
MSQIILASQSPRRQQLLKQAGVDFKTVIADTDETFPAALSIEEVATHIATEKGNKVLAMQDGQQDAIIISADTIVVLNQEIIGKPKNAQQAIDILKKISGKVHHVITGVAIMSKTKRKFFVETTEVEFYDLDDNDINHYVDIYKPFDKAGAYAIQEWIGLIGIKSIKGDFYNVMGLPVSRLIRELKLFSPDKISI